MPLITCYYLSIICNSQKSAFNSEVFFLVEMAKSWSLLAIIYRLYAILKNLHLIQKYFFLLKWQKVGQ